MKRALLILSTLALLQGSSAAQGTVSFGVFYSSLDPYGEWIPMDAGVFGWRPVQVVGDWRPYTVGQWVWTVDGWYWISEEPWGWATYHYGRWYFDDFYGWIWIPGYDWAPAWVEWRYGGNYVGWAPLGPYAIWGFGNGIWYNRHWRTPYHWWAFVHCQHIGSPGIHHHLYRSDENPRFVGKTRSAGNVRYRDGRIVSRGPERSFVESRGRIQVERAEIVERTDRGEQIMRGGSQSRIEVYRPRVEDRQVEMIEKPSRIREGDKRVGLEIGNTDVRTRSVERSTGRDAERTPQVNRDQRKQFERPQGGKVQERSVEPRKIERKSEVREQRKKEEPPRQGSRTDVSHSTKQQETRSSTPERPTARPSGTARTTSPSTRANPEQKRSDSGTGKKR